MSDQVYCSIADLWADLEVQGFEDVPNTLRKIRSASEWIERKLGTFIPITKTIWYDGDGTVHLFIEPILTAPTVVYDGTTLASTDFILYPRSKHWEDGPYTRLAVDPDSSALSVWKRERDVVSVLSSHGKYNKTVATGATVQDDPLAAAGVTMVVDNGGLVSPGDSLLVGSEQILILDYSGSGSDAGKNLNANAAAKDTVLTPETGHGINAGEVIRIDYEQMLVTKVQGATTLYVERQWGGTLRAAHVSTDDIYVYRTYSIERAINGTTAAEHAKDLAISKYRAPYPVHYLAVQIAALMIKKAKTGFVGKTADLEAGQVFYHNEFPKSVYKEIKDSYRC